MSLSLLFQKFKSLSPFAFVGAAVAITIKLLTAQTPSLQDSLNVNAEEDIAKIAYEDEIEIPEPIEESEEPAPEEAPSEDAAEEEREESGDQDSSSSEESFGEKEEEKKKQEEKKEKGRQWKNDSKSPVISLLKKLTQKK